VIFVARCKQYFCDIFSPKFFMALVFVQIFVTKVSSFLTSFPSTDKTFVEVRQNRSVLYNK
jgi:hypothetical protein